MKKNNRSYLLLPLLSIIVIVAIVMLTIMPKINEINTLNTNIESENTINTKLIAKRDALSTIKNNEAALKANYTLVSTALPDQKNIANLIISIEQLAERSNIAITTMQIAPGVLILQKPGISQNAEQIEISASITGRITDISNMLKEMYNSSRLINARAVNITTSEEGNNTAQIVMNAFYKPRPELPKNPEEELPQLSSADNELLRTIEQLSPISPDSVTN